MLLLETHPAARDALVRLLPQHGWTVTAVSTMREAVDALARPMRCGVVDHRLPDGDSAQLIQRMQAAHPPMGVIVMVSGIDADELEALRALRPDAILRKPVALDTLLQAMEQA